jgi:hypothetical protein
MSNGINFFEELLNKNIRSLMFLGNGIFLAGPNLALLKMGGFTFFQQGRAEFGPALTHLEFFYLCNIHISISFKI